MHSAILLREINERVDEAAHRLNVDDAEFLCECGRSDCGPARVTMTLTDFADCAASEDCWVVAPGHEPYGGEVVRSHERYVIVRRLVGAA
jgi:hypothetical protein